ncbi:oligosaccharide flippase family protein [Brevundimonas sp. NPDC092305]|uniref:oligosaccharide flippase family protein n=1 Tax=Brevundimonas sp. NPDC092305 TaxID=3363957 RepID=UPI0038092DA1
MTAFLYFVALFGSRLASLASLLVLARLLDPSSFSIYTVCITNALLAATIGGAWMTSGVTRLFPVRSATEQAADISTFAVLILIAGIIVLTVSGAVASFTRNNVLLSMLSAGLALSLLVSDLGLSASNAVRAHTTYAAASLVRGVGVAILPAAFFLLGRTIEWAIAGQIMGFLASIVLTTGARRLWTTALPWKLSLGRVQPYLSFGVAGTLLLSIYILINAGMRNVLAQWGDPEIAGQWAMLSDLFWGPLALGTTTLTLIWLPVLYSLREQEEERRVASGRYFAAISAVVAPFIIAGCLFAPVAVDLALPGPKSTQLGIMGQLACIQAGLLAVVYTLASILMTDGRKRDVVVLVAGTSAVVVGSLTCVVRLVPPEQALGLAVFVEALCLTAAAAWVLSRRLFRVNFKRASVAAVCVALSLTAGFAAWVFARSEIFAALAAGLVYLATAYPTGSLQPLVSSLSNRGN